MMKGVSLFAFFLPHFWCIPVMYWYKETLMKKIMYVALNRAEGPSRECKAIVYFRGTEAPVIEDRHFAGAEMRTVIGTNDEDLVSLVRGQMTKWGHSAPLGGGYDKVDFRVQWEGDESYTGRFDMERGGTESSLNFWESLKSRIEFYALKRRPAHFDDATWDDFCERSRANGNDKEAQKMLDECEIPIY